MTGVAHRWQPLTDLSDEESAAASDELPVLAETWDVVRGDLDPAQVEQFNERLQREWAIETGIIERLYTLDRGTTELLIERGIDASLIAHNATDQPPELVASIIRDQQGAVEWLFTFVRQERRLTTSFVQELHALITAHQAHTEARDPSGRQITVPLTRGEYKSQPNNPTRPGGSVHQYCPPEHVASEMDRLIDLHHRHMDGGVPPEVQAAWLHHRFTQIHPFQDGNGRVARALASLVLIQAGWFPLVVTRDDRERYITALEAADGGDLRPLIDQFVAIQSGSFRRAITITEQVRTEGQRVEAMLDAISDMFERREQAKRQEYDHAKVVARHLTDVAHQRFEEVREGLEERVSNGLVNLHSFVDQGLDEDPDRRTWHRYQVVRSADKLDYFASMRDYHDWIRLGLVTDNGRAELLLSLHGVGTAYRGLVGAAMTFYRRQEGEDVQAQIVELQPVSDDLFQVTFKDQPAAAERRFRPWLEESLVRGLDQWRRGE